jgi:hypothetical protein
VFLPFFFLFQKKIYNSGPSPGKCSGWPGPRSAHEFKKKKQR